MKKSSFIVYVLTIISSVLFALGMCMSLLSEWNAFKPGIIFGCAGIVLALITIFIWRRMENKVPIHLNKKTVLNVIVGIVGMLTLGIGMCFSMIWSQMILGIIIALVGLIFLFSLIPLIKGIK